MLDLEITLSLGTQEKKNSARKILPLLKQHHWLLVTLLLCNAVALEALPVFLEMIVPPAYAIIISVGAVLLFSEVIPQAICIGPHQLHIAEKTAPIVKFLMYMTYPISWPIAMFLDQVLGEHKLTRYNNIQLQSIIRMHALSELEKDEIKEHIQWAELG